MGKILATNTITAFALIMTTNFGLPAVVVGLLSTLVSTILVLKKS